MAKLILLRHLLSQWNEEDRFNGWVDTPLAEGQGKTAEEIARRVFQFRIDKVYCSRLFRNMDTVARIMEHDKKYPLFIHLEDGKMREWGNFTDLSEEDIPVYVSEKLNERYYGKLQGTNKKRMMEQYGQEQLAVWRRSWDVRPPGGESLKDVYKRVVPFYKEHIEKDLKSGKNILLVGSHNALRAIVKYIDKISDQDIQNFEIPYAGLKEYDM
jgi:2,3-bisphosphoglycerate-dependent phosphoglycerate mutase